MKALIYCEHCGRKMTLKPKKVGNLSHDKNTGERTRFIAGLTYPEKMVKGQFFCPSWLCRLWNYSIMNTHYDYYLVGDEIVREYHGDIAP